MPRPPSLAPSPRAAKPAQPPPRALRALGSLSLMIVSYGLLLAAPLVARTARSPRAGMLGGWQSTACAVGLALGGGAALIFVLVHLMREAERRPYTYLAPVVAAFSVCILSGLEAELPLPGMPAEHVAVLSLMLVVAGGWLLQERRLARQLTGFGLTLLPALTLLALLWVGSGRRDPADALWALAPQARAYLCMLTVSSFLVAIMAVAVGRPGSEEIASSSTGLIPSSTTPLVGRSRASAGLMLQDGLERSFGRAEPARAGWKIALLAAATLMLVYVGASFWLEARSAQHVPIGLLADLPPPSSAAALTNIAPDPEKAAAAADTEPLAPAASRATVEQQLAPEGERVRSRRHHRRRHGERSRRARGDDDDESEEAAPGSGRAEASNEAEPERADASLDRLIEDVIGSRSRKR